jgi:hypothetical protein
MPPTRDCRPLLLIATVKVGVFDPSDSVAVAFRSGSDLSLMPEIRRFHGHGLIPLRERNNCQNALLEKAVPWNFGRIATAPLPAALVRRGHWYRLLMSAFGGKADIDWTRFPP